MTYEQTRRRTLLSWLARRNTPAALRPLYARASADARTTAAGLTALQQPARQAAARLAAVQQPLPEREPTRPSTEHLCQRLTAVVDPTAASIEPGTYTVTVTLKGTGTGPETIEVTVDHPGDLAAGIARHAQARLGRQVDVTADPKCNGGVLRANTTPVGSFSYTPTEPLDAS